jgi:hypothetical protein
VYTTHSLLDDEINGKNQISEKKFNNEWTLLSKRLTRAVEPEMNGQQVGITNRQKGRLTDRPTNQLYGAENYLRDHQLHSHSIVSQHFMEPEGSLLHSQELSICLYPEPD